VWVEATLLLVVHCFCGLIMAGIYRLVWAGPFRVRHVLVWQVLWASTLLARCPPTWMAPAPRQMCSRR
jgi:hypothetical protein